mgnify:CR=1 FL=1
MNKKEFEQFVEESGKDILRYCRMIAYSNVKIARKARELRL